MTAIVIRADARTLPLPDASVDLIVTSPPYFGLRSYTDNGEHYDGQIGSEATPAEFLAALLACTREWMRVLKPSGSLFVNLGDKYAAGHGGSSTEGKGVNLTVQRDRPAAEHWTGPGSHPGNSRAFIVPGTRPKSLLGMPWRYALACMDDLGLILRAEIVWAKSNPLPESVTDRVRRSHEQIFHFTRQPRYYSAVDEVREPQKYPGDTGRTLVSHRVGAMDTPRGADRTDELGYFGKGPQTRSLNPIGKLPGSVWEIPSAPLTVPARLGVDHFAAYPPELCRRIILGWSPPGICTACGEGRRPVGGYDREPAYRDVEDKRISEAITTRWCSAFADWCEDHGVTRRALDAAAGTSDMGGWWASRLPHRCAVPTPEQYALLAARWPEIPAHPGDDLWEPFTRRVAWSFQDAAMHAGSAETGLHRHTAEPVKGLGRVITGYACACPDTTAPTRPALVVDPFGGTGTTALVASVLGRTGLSADLSHDYCRLAAWRTTDPAERARALGVPKPPPILDGQEALFEAVQ